MFSWSDVAQFKCTLFRMTALLVTSKDADRRLLQHLCISPVRLFDESVMESAIACWEWLLAARSDLRAQVTNRIFLQLRSFTICLGKRGNIYSYCL